MQLPLQITLRNLAHSDAVETAIRKRAEKLDRYHKHIVSCRVVVEIPSRHKQQGKEFVVRLDIKVPGSEIAINHDHHEDVYRAVQDAFLAARRKLEDHARRHVESRPDGADQDEAIADQ
jgi:ribosomal subunit interface protein